MNKCIICTKRITHVSESHIFPRSLGNNDITSPNLECKKCNNDSGNIEDSLCKFGPIPCYRALLGHYSRSGKKILASYENVTLKEDDNGILVISGRSYKKDDVKKELKINLKQSFSARKLKEVLRALYKIGLLCLGHDHGNEFVLDERFNEARLIIQGKKDFDGYLLLNIKNKPEELISMKITKKNDNKSTLTFYQFEFNVYGFILVFDCERRIVDFPEKLSEGWVHFITNP